MIKSMTGFGRCEIADEKRKFTVELKSVNHRYLDVDQPGAPQGESAGSEGDWNKQIGDMN